MSFLSLKFNRENSPRDSLGTPAGAQKDLLWKKSRRRMIAAIMAVLIILFAGTFATIYGVSFKELQDRNTRMLQNYIENYQFKQQDSTDQAAPQNQPKLWKNPLQPKDNRLFNAANFYSVVLDSNGAVYETENKNTKAMSTETLIDNARSIVAGNQESGTIGDLVYMVGHKSDYTIVAFMDSALIDNSTATLLRNTLLFGVIALAVLFFVARWLAMRIITPMKKAWEEERRFISDVSHELKTPLAVAATNAEVLQRSIGQNQWLDNINYEISSMSSLVSSMMDLTLTESSDTHSEEVNLSKLTEKEALAFEGIAFEQGRQFDCVVEPNLKIMACTTEIAQLVRVLLDNAMAHSVDNSPIIVRLHKQGVKVSLTVTNEISSQQVEEIDAVGLDNLFERFGRASAARTAPTNSCDAKHAGLGLAIAKAIATKAGGTINAEIISADSANPKFMVAVSFPLI